MFFVRNAGVPTQLIVWVGTRNPEVVAIGSESLSPWVKSERDEAPYALIATVAGELDAVPPEETKRRRTRAQEKWERWCAEAESKLRAGLLGLTGIPAGEASNRTIISSECTDLRLVGGNLTLLPKLTRQHPAHSDSPIAIKSPQVSRERVLAAYPPREFEQHDLHVLRWQRSRPLPPTSISEEQVAAAMSRPDWALTQAIIWAGTRDRELITYACERVSPFNNEPSFLIARVSQVLDERCFGPFKQELAGEWAAWQERLTHALQDRRISLNAQRIPQEPMQKIGPEALKALTVQGGYGERPRLVLQGGAGSSYAAALLDAADVRRAFPAASEDAPENRDATADSPLPPIQPPMGFNDAVRFRAMLELRTSGQARSVNHAARLVVERERENIPGNSDAAKIDRLARKFSEWNRSQNRPPK